MYNHSLLVKKLALKIASSIECDKELLTIKALLHDVGKTYKASSKVLQERHSELSFKVAGKFITELRLSASQQEKLKKFLKGVLGSTEAQIVKDADIIAFLADEKLQQAFKNWSVKQRLPGELQRKADKINKLKFENSKQIAVPLHKKMILKWKLQ